MTKQNVEVLFYIVLTAIVSFGGGFLVAAALAASAVAEGLK